MQPSKINTDSYIVNNYCLGKRVGIVSENESAKMLWETWDRDVEKLQNAKRHAGDTRSVGRQLSYGARSCACHFRGAVVSRRWRCTWISELVHRLERHTAICAKASRGWWMCKCVSEFVHRVEHHVYVRSQQRVCNNCVCETQWEEADCIWPWAEWYEPSSGVSIFKGGGACAFPSTKDCHRDRVKEVHNPGWVERWMLYTHS
jgi:hypothetical protein